MNRYKKICKRPGCNVEFLASHNHKKYCSSKCNRIHYEDTHPAYVEKYKLYQRNYRKTHKKKKSRVGKGIKICS